MLSLKKVEELDIEIPMVIFVCTDKIPTNPNTEFYKKTLSDNDWLCMQVGEGEKWDGFKFKIKKYFEVLDKIKDEQLVVVTDAHDVFCVRNMKHFKEAFSSFKKDIVVSMEMFAEGKTVYNPEKKYFQVACLDDYWRYYGKENTSFRKFVNSGLIAGKCRDIREFFKWAYLNKLEDDQKALGEYMCLKPEKIAADVDGILLHTCSAGMNAGIYNHEQKEDSPTLLELFGRKSFFLHIPGIKISKGQTMIYDCTK